MQAVDYGIGCGHTKIAYIGGKKNFRSTKEREKGVLKSLKKRASLSIQPIFNRRLQLRKRPPKHGIPIITF